MAAQYLKSKNYANISEHIKFIDSVKHYQQSLATLANTMTTEEKENIEMSCKKLMQRDQKLNQKF